MSCSEITDPTDVRLKPSVNSSESDIEMTVEFTEGASGGTCTPGDCCSWVLLSFKSQQESGHIDTFTLKVDDGASQAFTVLTAGKDSSGPYSGVWSKDSTANPPFSRMDVSIPPGDGDVVSLVFVIKTMVSTSLLQRTQTVIIKRRPPA